MTCVSQLHGLLVIDKAHPRMASVSELLSMVLNLYGLCYSQRARSLVSSHFETKPRDRPEKARPLLAGKDRHPGFYCCRGVREHVLGAQNEQEVLELESICPGASVFLGLVPCPVAGLCLSQHLRWVSGKPPSSLTGTKAPGSPGLGGSRLRAVLCLLVLGCIQKNLVKPSEKEVGFSCSWR